MHGKAAVKGVFRHRVTGEQTPVEPGPFRLSLPPGEYDVEFSGMRQLLVLADGARRELHLDPAHAIDLTVTATPASRGRVDVRIAAAGAGRHRLALRAGNAELPEVGLDCDPSEEGTQILEFSLQIREQDRPWVLVVVPDGRLEAAVESFGTPELLPDLSIDRSPI